MSKDLEICDEIFLCGASTCHVCMYVDLKQCVNWKVKPCRVYCFAKGYLFNYLGTWLRAVKISSWNRLRKEFRTHDLVVNYTCTIANYVHVQWFFLKVFEVLPKAWIISTKYCKKQCVQSSTYALLSITRVQLPIMCMYVHTRNLFKGL
jgi:hypothetical protein